MLQAYQSPVQVQAAAILELRRRARADGGLPSVRFVNSRTGQAYIPHHADESHAVYSDTPRYVLIKGGEGGGKTVAGSIKTLLRVQRGESGIVVSPDLPHFRRSLWPEFRSWVPREWVVQRYRYMLDPDWFPRESFTIPFTTGAVLFCGGMEDPASWMGPNVHFAWLDEARRCRGASPLKVLDGRVRLVGRSGHLPQVFITTTPRRSQRGLGDHWLYEYFGPLQDKDLHASFKAQSLVVTLRTEDNAANLSPDYLALRATSLSEKERRIFLDAEWEDEELESSFLPNVLVWDSLRAERTQEWETCPVVMALDAAVTGTFGLVCVGQVGGKFVVPVVQAWTPPPGRSLDYGEVEAFIRDVCRRRRVAQIAYDPYQLHDMATRLARDRVAWVEPFGQVADRLVADRLLLDVILQGHIAHDGNQTLREHVLNAERKIEGEHLRIVRRYADAPVDLAVCLSMAVSRATELNLR